LYLPAKVAIEAQEMAALLGCSQSRLYAAAVESALEEWRWAEMIGLKPEDVRRLAAFLRRIGKTESEVQEWLREKENRA
jgi:predicted DNA-binding transcriptional regulator AlpA